ncbi:MAG: peptide-methionine (S)-S-oxide reductase MsrA [Bacteroidota bacterium]
MKIVTLFAFLFAASCQTQGSTEDSETAKNLPASQAYDPQKLDTATLAGGCFWCVEAAFEQIKGVKEAVSGYSGGDAKTADYKLVSSGRTGHAEAVQVMYDAAVIDFETILDIFFTAHDPTQVDRQGNDIGPQYRSEIFYHNEEQRQIAVAKIDEIASDFSRPIATKLTALDVFYEAEEYHQDYEKKNPYNGYIVNVSRPKIEKVARKFKERLKE